MFQAQLDPEALYLPSGICLSPPFGYALLSVSLILKHALLPSGKNSHQKPQVEHFQVSNPR